MSDVMKMLEACCAGQDSIVLDLLGRTPQLANARGWPIDTTALILAAHRGYGTIVDALLAAGAEVDGREGASNTTALHWAAEGGHPEVIAALLDRGADLEARDGWFALSPLGWSIYASWAPQRHRDRPTASTLLLASGAKLDPFSAILLRRIRAIDAREVSRRLGWTERSRTPLHIAVSKNDDEAIDALLALGADPHLADDFGVTPAALARADRFARSDTDLSFLIAREDWARAKAIGGFGVGLLAWAAEDNRTSAVEFLLREGVSPNDTVPHLVDELPNRVTPLYFAEKYGSDESARALLAAGAVSVKSAAAR